MNHKVYQASNRDVHLWAVGSMADYMLFVAFNALIMPVFVTGFGMDAPMVGWALVLPRFLDALIDPVLGRFSDNFQSRWGRRRPFMVFAASLGATMLITMWWASPDWAKWAQFAWLLTCSILLYFSYGMYTMAFQALGYELTDDHHQRAKVQAVRGMYFSIAAMAGGWIYNWAQHPVFGNEIHGIRMISIVLGAVLILAAFLSAFHSRERFSQANRKHVNLATALRSTLTLRPFAVLLSIRIIGSLSGLGGASIAFFITTYYVCQGDKVVATSLSGYNGMVGFALSLLLVPLSTWLSKRIERRWGVILASAVVAVGAIAAPLVAQPGHPYTYLAYMIVLASLNMIFGIFMTAIMPDICDIDELESGERREGLFSAVLAFQSKVENSVCILASSYLISWSGFNAAAARSGIPQTPESIRLMWWLAFIPPIVFSLIALGISFYFPITRKMMDEVREKLAVRRAAKAAKDAGSADDPEGKVRLQGLNPSAEAPEAA